MAWKMISSKKVAHKDGHVIELVLGSWRTPYEINPKIVRGTEAMASVKLIREGMAYAAKNSVTQRTETYS